MYYMATRKKSAKTILISLVTFLISVGFSAAAGKNIDFEGIKDDILGTKVKTKTFGKCKPNSLEEAKFVRGVDGDTIEISGGCADKIRLLYIDTPETVKPNTPVMCYGPEASNHTKKQFQENQILYLKSDKDVSDRYGRELRILYFNKSDVDNFAKSYNYQLAAEGYGLAKFYSPNTTYKKEMLEAQSIAQKSKKGLWGKC
jgi:micrococcal nuclease